MWSGGISSNCDLLSVSEQKKSSALSRARRRSGEELGIVFLENAPVIVSITGMKGLDQPVDPRRHHEQVARGLRSRRSR
jgi:hypothetical protein